MTFPQVWSATVGQGSTGTWQAAFTNPDLTPYNITGFTWEYVIRSRDSGVTRIPLTTTPGPNGQLVVTTGTQSLVVIQLLPAATATLNPGAYDHALWSNPGTTAEFCWFTGSLTVRAVPQP